MHLQGETGIIYECGFTDAWLDVYGEDQSDGYTWDPETNGMLNILFPLDNRLLPILF